MHDCRSGWAAKGSRSSLVGASLPPLFCSTTYAGSTESVVLAASSLSLLRWSVTRIGGSWDRMCVASDGLEECYRDHAPALVRFAASLVGPSDAEDVVAAAVANVLRTSPDAHDLRAYLYRAVSNLAKQHWRSLGRRERREALRAVSEETVAVEIDHQVTGALVSLSSQQRAVVHLVYWEDLTPSMAAERLGVTDGTVRRQLARARRRLAEVLRG